MTDARIVLANGCFDALHHGHVGHLMEAKGYGGRLIVALTLDENVGKAGRPIFDWGKRATMLRALRCVDEVIPASCSVEAILAVKPTIFVKGRDYLDAPFKEDIAGACAQVGAEIRFTHSEKFSTTELLQKMLQKRFEEPGGYDFR